MHELADARVVQTQKDEAAATRLQKLRESILKLLQTEIEAQKNRMDLADDLVAIEGASDVREPTQNTLETLQRYRTANMREFTHLMDSFERIRDLRKNAIQAPRGSSRHRVVP
jgi:predicted metal-dependent hydrolase